MKDIHDFFVNETAYSDLDEAGAAKRLSAAIQCRTINRGTEEELAEFDRLHEHIRASYPGVMAAGTMEIIGRRSILITLPGSDSSLKPCLFMSHQDVVPVVEGTEDDWIYPAFSGAIEEGYIWGRGTLDIKQQVFGCFEAMEYLLAHGARLKRTVYLAFGDDEETLNRGALKIAETLRERGVRLEFVLDEGGGKIESAAAYGAPAAYITAIDLMEKGYADLELSAKSEGGHSSRPFGGTSLGQLCQAVAHIVEHPFPVTLTPVMERAFGVLAPYITEEPLKSLVKDVKANAQAIADYCYGVRELFPYVTTTIAPTMMVGGSAACNVMPQNMHAVVNFRIAEGATVEDVRAKAEAAIGTLPLTYRFIQANDPSATARSDGYGYKRLTESMGRFFDGVVFVPSLTPGATDAHHYEIVCDTCLRCSPFMASPEDVRRGVHGTDERISLRSYAQGIRVLIDLMQHTAVEP